METVRGLVMQRTDRSMANTLSKEELDNVCTCLPVLIIQEAYLFKAALSKLRTEHSIRNRNTGIAARSAVSAIRRELDSVEVKMAEDVQVLKHDIELDVNNRKTDTRSDMKWADIQIEEINNRATISIGDLKTEIESAKWEATRRAIGACGAVHLSPQLSLSCLSCLAWPSRHLPFRTRRLPFLPRLHRLCRMQPHRHPRCVMLVLAQRRTTSTTKQGSTSFSLKSRRPSARSVHAARPSQTHSLAVFKRYNNLMLITYASILSLSTAKSWCSLLWRLADGESDKWRRTTRFRPNPAS